MKNVTWALIGSLGLWGFCFGAQQKGTTAAPSHSHVSTVVPFELTKNIAFFQVHVKGSSRPIWFDLDSGSGSAYMDAGVARSLRLQVHGEGTVRGVGSGAVPVQFADSVTFEVPGLEWTEHEIKIIDFKPDDEGFGRATEGTMGYDLFSRYVVVVDYAAKKMTIYDPTSFKYTGKGQALSVHLRNHWPYIDGIIKVKGLAAQRGEFLVDTGSGDAVDHPAIAKSTGPLRKIKTGVGFGAASEGVLGRAEYLELGNYRLEGPIAACCSPNPDDREVIGGEVLRRFTVIFDYPHRRIILEPNRNFAEAFPNA